jgi:hypothetical protein
VRTFIRQRLDAVRIGSTGHQLIDDESIGLITQLTGGIPGEIAHLMRAALLNLALPDRSIDPVLIRDVASTLAVSGTRPVTTPAGTSARRDPVIQTRMPLDLFPGEEGTP